MAGHVTLELQIDAVSRPTVPDATSLCIRRIGMFEVAIREVVTSAGGGEIEGPSSASDEWRRTVIRGPIECRVDGNRMGCNASEITDRRPKDQGVEARKTRWIREGRSRCDRCSRQYDRRDQRSKGQPDTVTLS